MVALPGNEGTNSQIFLEIHRTTNPEKYHVFTCKELQAQKINDDKNNVQKMYYLDHLKDYWIRPMITQFQLDKDILKEDITCSIKTLIRRYEISGKHDEYLRNIDFVSNKMVFAAAVREMNKGSLLFSDLPENTIPNQELKYVYSEEALGFHEAIKQAVDFIKQINAKHLIFSDVQLKEIMEYADYYISKWNLLNEKMNENTKE